MEDTDLRQLLQDLLDGMTCDGDVADSVCEVTTFADAGVLTNNEGLVVSFDDGTQFQVTLVRSR